MRDEFVLAFKNLKHRGLRSWLTLFGVFIGVSAVVSLISLGAGLEAAVNAQFKISNTKIITVQAGGKMMGPPGLGVSNPLTVDDLNALKKISSIDKVVRRNILTGRMVYNDRMQVVVVGTLPKDEEDFFYEAFDLEAEFGRLLRNNDRGKVLLGYNFYEDKVGFGKPIFPGKKVLIQGRKFDVVGILKKKGSFMLDNLVVMGQSDAEDLWDYGDRVDMIVVEVKDEDLMDRVKEDIEKVLRRRRNVKKGQEDFEVSTPAAIKAKINSILSGVRAFVIILASVSILIGAFGIINTMMTSVVERRKDIGIMKAIGARNSQIFLQFFVESGLLGLVGGLAGVLFGTALGFLGTSALHKLLGVEAGINFDFVLIFLVIVGSFVVGSVSGILPAMRAAKQNPVEALRG